MTQPTPRESLLRRLDLHDEGVHAAFPGELVDDKMTTKSSESFSV